MPAGTDGARRHEFHPLDRFQANTNQVADTNLVATTDEAGYDSARLDLAVLLGNREDKVRAMGEHNYDKEVERLQRLLAIMLADKDPVAGKRTRLRTASPRMKRPFPPGNQQY